MSPVQRKSPLVQIKEPYCNLDMVTCMPGVYNVHLPIMLESKRQAVRKMMSTQMRMKEVMYLMN